MLGLTSLSPSRVPEVRNGICFRNQKSSPIVTWPSASLFVEDQILFSLLFATYLRSMVSLHLYRPSFTCGEPVEPDLAKYERAYCCLLFVHWSLLFGETVQFSQPGSQGLFQTREKALGTRLQFSKFSPMRILEQLK